MTDGLANAGFDLDLKEGQYSENELSKALSFGKVEVKRDKKCADTGNLFVEYRYKGFASGISVSTADYWAFEYCDGNWLLVPLERLKTLARRAFSEGRIKAGGDYNRSIGVLIPIEWMVRI